MEPVKGFNLDMLLNEEQWKDRPKIFREFLPRVRFLLWDEEQHTLVKYWVVTLFEGYMAQRFGDQVASVSDLPLPANNNYVAVIAQPMHTASPKRFVGYFPHEGGIYGFISKVSRMTIRDYLAASMLG